MRRKEKQVTDLKAISDVIHRAQVCRLALVDGSKPYIVPLSFGFDGNHIYIHSAQEGRKVELLKANQNVCMEFEENIKILTAEQPCNWGVRYWTVIGQGTAELITDLTEKNYCLNQIVRHYDPEAIEYSFSGEELDSVLVYRIKLTEITGKISG